MCVRDHHFRELKRACWTLSLVKLCVLEDRLKFKKYVEKNMYFCALSNCFERDYL